jgi:glycine/serine hydroxymethyltransferase
MPPKNESAKNKLGNPVATIPIEYANAVLAATHAHFQGEMPMRWLIIAQTARIAAAVHPFSMPDFQVFSAV